MPLPSAKRLLLSALFILAPTGSVHAEWLHHRGEMMGTELLITLWHERRSAGEAAIHAVIEDMTAINQVMSPYLDDSELSRINARGGRRPVTVSTQLLELLERARKISEITDGAFDITYASVGHLYDYRRGTKRASAAVEQRLLAVDYRHVEIDRQAGTAALRRPGVRIDLGGIAKGHAVERSAAILREHGVAHAQVSLGGDTRLVGDHRGRPWRIGVRHPPRCGQDRRAYPTDRRGGIHFWRLPAARALTAAG